MDKIAQRITEIERLKKDVSDSYKRMQIASEAFSKAVHTGTGDFTSLGFAAQESGREYQKTKTAAIGFMRSSQKLLRSGADTTRKRGMIFEHEAESALPQKADDYDQQLALNSIQLVQDGMRALISAVETFDSLQSQICQNIKELETAMSLIDNLGTKENEDDETLKVLKSRFSEVTESRESLLEDTHSLLLAWNERIASSLDTQIDLAYQDFEAAVERLIALEAITDEEIEYAQVLEEKVNSPDWEKTEQALTQIKSLHVKFNQHADSARKELEAGIENLKLKAQNAIGSLHPHMPEVVALNNVLNVDGHLEASDLFAYWKRINTCVYESKNAGINAVKRFQDKLEENDNYVFTNLDQVNLMGTAVVCVSQDPSQCFASLWDIGADVMVRAELAMIEEFNEASFYEQFGYPAIVNAIDAAIEQGIFAPLHILGIFNSGFTPSGEEVSQDDATTLLNNPLVKKVFQKASIANTLKLDVEEFYTWDYAYHKALLTILKYGKELGLPLLVKLQWSAILHDTFPLQSKEHHETSVLLLNELLNSGQYLSLYYILQALGPFYNNLWENARFRPMLLHIIVQAFNLDIEGDANGKRFLINLCTNPDVRRLAEGDFGSQFLLASLAHHAAVRWDKFRLTNEAWATWGKLEPHYPTLVSVLYRDLQGEHFGSNITTSVADLKHEFDDLIKDLSARMRVLANNHPVVYAVHNWYVDEYMSHWLERLASENLSKKELDSLFEEISKCRNVDDLFTSSKALQTVSSRAQRGLSNRAKIPAIKRLLNLLDSFQLAVRIRKQLISKAHEEPLSRKALQKELDKICDQSQTAKWAINRLLSPSLPFIRNLLDDVI